MKFPLSSRAIYILFIVLALVLPGCNEPDNDLKALSNQFCAALGDSDVPLTDEQILQLRQAISNLSESEQDELKEEMKLKKPHSESRLILKMKEGVPSDRVENILRGIGLEVQYQFKSGSLLVELPKLLKADGIIAASSCLKENGDVQYVEPDHVISLSFTPNDPNFSQMYGLNNTGQTGGTAGSDIRAKFAWDVQRGSRDVLVAILDSGIDYNHVDLAANIYQNPGEVGLDTNGNEKSSNGIDDDNNGYVDDFRGMHFFDQNKSNNNPIDQNNHGTHVAGTVGAVGNNGIGVTGVAHEVSLVPIRFLGADGSGFTSDGVRGVEYATALGVDIINGSFGGGGFSQAMFDALAAAGDRGILFVAAAGNESNDNDLNPAFPASYDLPNVISVAATDDEDKLASFSNFGATSVDLSAPGVSILSTIPGNLYANFSGTSMASPHVAGMAAVIKAQYPSISIADLRERLMRTVDPVSALSGKVASGGRANLANALVEDDAAPGLVGNLSLVSTSVASATLSWNEAGDDGNVGNAQEYEVAYSSSPITNTAAFLAAKRVIPSSLSISNGVVTAEVSTLPIGSTYVGVRAVDDVGKVGDPDSIQITVAGEYVYSTQGNSLAGITTNNWGIQSFGGNSFFSDSVNAFYQPSTISVLELPEIEINSSNVRLIFEHAYLLETDFDFGYVEVSGDGGQSYSEVLRFSGAQASLKTELVDLSGLLSGSTSLRVRFILESDPLVEYDGWVIDSISVVSDALGSGVLADVLLPPSALTNKAQQTLSVFDYFGNADGYRYYVGTSACDQIVGNDYTVVGNIDTPLEISLNGDGDYHLCLQGRVGSDFQSVATEHSFRLDTVAPNVPELAGFPKQFVNISQAAISVTDPSGDGTLIRFYLGNKKCPEVGDNELLGATLPFIGDLDLPADGTYYFCGHSLDGAGNKSASFEVSWTLDTVDPVFTLSGIPAVPTTDTSTNIILSSSELFTYQYVASETPCEEVTADSFSEPADGAEPLVVAIPEEKGYLCLKASDLAGNVAGPMGLELLRGAADVIVDNGGLQASNQTSAASLASSLSLGGGCNTVHGNYSANSIIGWFASFFLVFLQFFLILMRRMRPQRLLQKVRGRRFFRKI